MDDVSFINGSRLTFGSGTVVFVDEGPVLGADEMDDETVGDEGDDRRGDGFGE